eukprot:4657279-Heterocapsa_arctica.AAC.1
MLKEMNEDLVKANLEEARRTRDIVRDLADSLTKRRARSSGTDTSTSEQRNRRPKEKDAKKSKRSKPGEGTD